MNSDLAALMRKACDDLIKSGKDAGEEYVNYLKDIKKGLEDSGSTYQDAENDITRSIGRVGADGARDGEQGLDQAGHDAAGGLADADEPKAGITSGGTSSAETGATDPVDLVSGQLLDSVTDAVLPGVLPLVLRRSYASGYEHGALLGPGWASTLDTRLLAGGDGSVRFLGDDAQCLDFGVPQPVRLMLGEPAYPEFGPRWALDLDSDGRSWTVTDPRAGLTYRFAGDGAVRPLSVISDRSGNEIRVHRDDDGNPVRLEHSGGYRVRVALADTPAGTRLAGYDLEDGTRLAGFGYDGAGCLVTVSDSLGTDHRYSYDSHARIRSWTDRSGFEYPYRYDESGRVIETGEPGGFKHARIDYDPGARVTRVTDALGHTSEYHYDRFQQVTRIVDPLGAQTRLRRDDRGRVLEQTTPLGRTTRFAYDGDGNPVRITYPDGQSLSMTYHSPGRLSRVDLPDGATWQYTWDDRGNVLTETDPLGAVTRFEHDERGAPAAITDPLGAVTRYENNAAGLPVAAIDPNGGRTTITRDPQGRITAVTTPAGATTRMERDSEGRVIAEIAPDSTVTRYEFDAAGNRTGITDPSGRTSRFEYGPFYLPVSRVNPDGARYDFGYDAELQLTTVTGPTGLRWSYQYDEAGRRVAERDFDGLEQSYAFDEDGRVVSHTAPDGQVTAYERDAAGRLIELRAGGEVSRFGYDATGRLARAENADATVTFTRDLLGRAVREEINGQAVTRDYDAAGNLATRVTPSGAVSAWTYDALGAPSRLTAGRDTLAFAYDPAGREIRRDLGGVSLLQAYDDAGMLAGQRLTSGDRVLQERTYGYNSDGLPVRITDLLRGTRDLALDHAGRVTGVVGAGTAERYSYDSIGNLAHADITGLGGEDAGGQFTAAGTRITHAGRTTYSYDTRGRLTGKTRRTLSGQRQSWTYTWNAQNRLTSVTRPDGQQWAYRYDALGRRVEKTRLAADGTAAETTRFAWDGAIVAEQTAVSGDDTAASLTWDYEPGGFRPAVQRRSSQADTDAEFWAIVTDLTGTPQELVSPDARVDWAQRTLLWGRPMGGDGSSAAVGCPLGFPGQYRDDETGLYYNNQRYYDPDIGAYLSPDPLGLDASPHPQRYVPNPLTATDPLGLTPSGPASRPKTDTELQADADLIHEGFRIKYGNRSHSGTTVSTYEADSGERYFTVNGNKTYKGIGDIGKYLGYERKAGKDLLVEADEAKKLGLDTPRTHSEHVLLNAVDKGKVPGEGRVAISRVPCDERTASGSDPQGCGQRLAEYAGIRRVGRYAN